APIYATTHRLCAGPAVPVPSALGRPMSFGLDEPAVFLGHTKSSKGPVFAPLAWRHRDIADTAAASVLLPLSTGAAPGILRAGEGPFRPAMAASWGVNLWATPFAWAASPPLCPASRASLGVNWWAKP